jgi:hypothetical protein
LDHTVDVFFTDLRLNAPQANTTAQPWVIETGAAGVYAKGVVTSWGKNNLLIKNSTGTGGAAGTYGASPSELFIDQCVFDSATGGDSILVDATIDTNYLSAHFTNCWVASAGWGAGIITTPASHGIHLSGGQEFTFINGRIQRSSGNGVLIDNANVANVTISGGTRIQSNNQDNAADQHGAYLTAAATFVDISGNLIGNTAIAGGHQKFAIKIAAVAAASFRAVNNDMSLNVTGLISNANTASYLIQSSGVTSNFDTAVAFGIEAGGAVASFGQNTTTNPKQLSISATPASNQIDFQGVQQNVGFNQTLRFTQTVAAPRCSTTCT